MSLFRRARGRLLAPVLLSVLSTFLLSCGTQPNVNTPATGTPTVAEAEKFMADAEARLNDLGLRAGRASWVQSNFITEDTEVLSADTNKDYIAAVTELAEAARRFGQLQKPEALARKFALLKLALVLPAPADPAESRDPEELKRIWVGWHTVSPPYRQKYARFVELSNKGAREMGFKDVGAMWRSNFDMKPDEFAAEMERLWQQVRPLYNSLYVYTRAKLNQKYGDAVVPKNGPIPAHLLGNMWSQEWGNIYDLLQPPAADPGYNLTEILRRRNTDPKQLVRYGEGFFTSLGFEALPATFWERSLFVKPADREVVCHASAWDIDAQKDVRLKMCIQINEVDFQTVHHELGHNYYQMAYAPQPYLFQSSANEGFHEAIGDAVALSVTPEYLKQLGFIERVPDASADTGLLLKSALARVAFLPFGYLVDQWRWKVFSGEVGPNDYNKAWWELREKYQGIAPPVPRTEQDFDPGAKYHVPANTPYARYFLAHILQFQFHRALCREAGFTGPLYQCSIYGNKKAGEKLKAMLAMGASEPWPVALKAMTGEDKMDATAIIDYFAPLKAWLDQQNGKPATD